MLLQEAPEKDGTNCSASGKLCTGNVLELEETSLGNASGTKVLLQSFPSITWLTLLSTQAKEPALGREIWLR